MNCDFNLQIMKSELPNDSFVKKLCPVSCKTCPPSTATVFPEYVVEPVEPIGPKAAVVNKGAVQATPPAQPRVNKPPTFQPTVSSKPTKPPARPSTQAELSRIMECKDDSTGEVKQSGLSCTVLKSLGCGTDLHAMRPDLPKGSLVKLACPVTCDACP